MRKTPVLLSRLAALDTNTVSDALDFLELPGATVGLTPLWECPQIVGRASTVQLAEKQDQKPTAHLISPVIDATTDNDRILVIAGGSEGVSCWGDILANAAKYKQMRGSIIDGFSRDIKGSESINYPVYGRGLTMVSARNRVIQMDAGCAISVAGVTVCEDDYVIADRCGSVFIAADYIEAVLDLAEKIDARQNGMVDAVRAGRSVADVMHDSAFEAINAPDTLGRAQLSPEKSDSGPDSVPSQTGGQNRKENEIVSLFKGLDTAAVSDAMDKLGLHGQALGIMPLQDYSDVVVGPAFTVKYVPVGSPAGTVGDYIDDVAPGDVVVIDNDGRSDCTVWGDILTQYAGMHGIAGTVIDGVCRDVKKAMQDQYPLFSAGRFMRTGKDRVEVESVNTPIAVGGVRVAARDIVVADANGVVVVPQQHAREVAETAHEIERVEAAIRAGIAAGNSIRVTREQLNYHSLQRKAQ